jgi:hypothetical protein
MDGGGRLTDGPEPECPFDEFNALETGGISRALLTERVYNAASAIKKLPDRGRPQSSHRSPYWAGGWGFFWPLHPGVLASMFASTDEGHRGMRLLYTKDVVEISRNKDEIVCGVTAVTTRSTVHGTFRGFNEDGHQLHEWSRDR